MVTIHWPITEAYSSRRDQGLFMEGVSSVELLMRGRSPPLIWRGPFNIGPGGRCEQAEAQLQVVTAIGYILKFDGSPVADALS